MVKLADFGVSEMFQASGDDTLRAAGGSPAFLSPESFSASLTEVHGKPVDFWALGEPSSSYGKLTIQESHCTVC